MMFKKMALLSVFIIGGIVMQAQAATTVFQPGTEGFNTVYGTAYLPGPNGDAETLYDGGWGDYYYDFFKWDLSSLPSANNVSKVLLYLYFNTTGNDPAFQVQRVISSWDEATLTRNNYPSATAWRNWTGIINTGWYSLDITELYKNWENGTWPNYGIELVPTANNHTNGHIISSDYQADPTLRPKLVISYADVSPQYLGVTAIPDVNGDGVMDQAVIAMKSGNYYLQTIDSVTGKRLKQVVLGTVKSITPKDLTAVETQISVLIKNRTGASVLQLRDNTTLFLLKRLTLP
jgi:hypothetical protein